MSEAPHGAPIKTPGQLIAAVIAGFGVPIAIIILLAVYVNNSTRTGAGTDIEQSVNQRIAPAAQVDVRDANPPRTYKTGEEVFKAVCSACHANGTAGAPKFGDSTAWAPRISKGYDTLLHNALNGKGGMPARGGTNPDDYSDFEIARAVVYMANGGGSKFPEPAQPAPVAAASGGASAPAGASGAAGAVAKTRKPPQRSRRSHPCRRRRPRRRAARRAQTTRRRARRFTSRSARRATRRACSARRSSTTRQPGRRA